MSVFDNLLSVLKCLIRQADSTDIISYPRCKNGVRQVVCKKQAAERRHLAVHHFHNKGK